MAIAVLISVATSGLHALRMRTDPAYAIRRLEEEIAWARVGEYYAAQSLQNAARASGRAMTPMGALQEDVGLLQQTYQVQAFSERRQRLERELEVARARLGR